MRLLTLLLALFIAAPASAQVFGPALYVPAASASPSCTGGYQGPGDVQATWSFWGGLRAYSCATAGTKAVNVCNSGDANCADVSTLLNGDFDVATAQAAPLNCGTTGGTCTIKTWYDKSGNVKDFTQATAANRWQLVFNCLNTSKPCATLTSGSQSGSTSTATLANPFSLWLVGERVSNSGFTNVVLTDTGCGPPCQAALEWHGNASQIGLDISGSSVFAPSGTVADGAFHMIVGTNTTGAAGAALYADSSTAAATGTGNSSGGFGTMALGVYGSGGAQIKIAEFGGIGGTALSTAVIGNLHSNTSAYWGTP